MANTGIGDLAALGEQRLVVGGVLPESPKLLEGIVHRLRPWRTGQHNAAAYLHRSSWV